MEQTTAFPESETRPPGKPANIAPDLQKLPLVSPWDLKHHPRNPRRHKLEVITESIRNFGQQSPIVVQKSTGFVCKGNGTLKVIRDILQWDKVAVSVEDFDDDQALQYLLADNRASEAGYNDAEQLGQLLKEQDAKGTLQMTAWDLDSAETVWAEIGALTITNPEEFKGGYAETPEELAARAERISTHNTGLKEVVLALKAEDYAEFALNVAALSRAYGTSGVIATVLEAMRRAAGQVQ